MDNEEALMILRGYIPSNISGRQLEAYDTIRKLVRGTQQAEPINDKECPACHSSNIHTSHECLECEYNWTED